MPLPSGVETNWSCFAEPYSENSAIVIAGGSILSISPSILFVDLNIACVADRILRCVDAKEMRKRGVANQAHLCKTKTSLDPSLKQLLLISISALSLCTAVHAIVQPHALFSDHAVLQQNVKVPVWGTASEGEKVTVEFQGQTLSTVAKNGRWQVVLPPLQPGGPFTLTIVGENRIVVQDVLVGEVWICGGQSNMARPLGLHPPLQPLVNWEQEAASANYPQMRHFAINRSASDTPQADVKGKWEVCSPRTAPQFTAIGYYFGRDLTRKLNLPVGLINNAVPGTPAEAWTSPETLRSVPEFKTILERHAEAVQKWDPAKAEEDYKKALEKFHVAEAAAKQAGKPVPPPPGKAQDPKGHKRPGGLYNGMVHPLQPYAIRGVIWYQGENNNDRAKEYQTLFPAMIADWRRTMAQGDFPFLFVQLAPFQKIGPEIREAQLMTWQKTPHTAMVVTVDCGDAKDIHPTRKEPVGARLALAARALAYGEKLEYSGPVFAAMKVNDSRALLTFTHAANGLTSKGGPLKGFTVAGADKRFVPAEARIEGSSVVVTSPEVIAPVAVRYGWEKVPDVNLFNQEGLPASPFRTDTE